MDVLLVLDVGNTNTSIGIFHGQKLQNSWRIRTDKCMTADELGLTLGMMLAASKELAVSVTACVISSVVPPVLPTVIRAVETYFMVSPLVVGPGVKTGIPIRYEDPRELGADRIANAVAVMHHYQPPAIIVDLGTATTFSVIDEKGQYLGGSISPGVMTAAEALFDRASRLPQVELSWPEKLVQRNTVLSMQAGILFGASAMVDGLVQQVRREYPLPFVVIATGGISALLAEHMASVDVINPDLALEGLRLLWERNLHKPRP